MDFEIIRPAYLSLLALIPFLIFLHFFMLKKKRSHALRFANFEAIARVSGVDLISKNIFVLALTLLITILLIFSLAGVNIQRTLYSSAFSYVIAIDASSSMEATDILPNRFEVAKESASNFVMASPTGTKIGIISFSGNAFIEQALTEDKNALVGTIEKIPLSSIGGTDLSEAIVTATNLLEGEEAKTVILLSDGRINVGGLDNAITYANNRNVIIHTLGIGTERGGATSFGLSKIDEDALKAIAYNTNGKYFKIDSAESLSESFNQIMRLKFKKTKTDITPYLVFFALFLFLVEYILINTRFRVLP